LWWTTFPASGAIRVRVSVPPMDYQVPNVGNPGEEIGEDEYGVLLVQRIHQEQERSGQA
jgi:hypothetical protein